MSISGLNNNHIILEFSKEPIETLQLSSLDDTQTGCMNNYRLLELEENSKHIYEQNKHLRCCQTFLAKLKNSNTLCQSLQGSSVST